MSEHRLKIGITQGDPNGIGWEVILKALGDPRMTELFTPVVYGSPKAAAFYRNTLRDAEPVAFVPAASAAEARRGKVNLVTAGEVAAVEPGKPTPEAGRAAVEALRAAVEDLKAGHIDAVVTAPFDKETVQSDDFRHTGHTEFFGETFGGEPMMIMCSDVLRVGLVTKHIPVSEIARSISREKIVRDLETLRRSLIEDFGIVEPRIAVNEETNNEEMFTALAEKVAALDGSAAPADFAASVQFLQARNILDATLAENFADPSATADAASCYMLAARLYEYLLTLPGASAYEAIDRLAS